MKLIQNQKLCRYHANQMWEEYPDMTLIIQNVDNPIECDECARQWGDLLVALRRHPEITMEDVNRMEFIDER
ncbi:hypothetical protein Goe5_c01910 [Bacillus phage vB_BthM-Goe5]|nr:hypothetical protein Goe5_c01910 [Bacillus phage vB_BthM-Goe5]